MNTTNQPIGKFCLHCKSFFKEKKIFGECRECKTCPNLCDACQSTINNMQVKIKERLKNDPSNFSIPMEVKFVSIEVSEPYPFLLKETFEGYNTGKKIETYYYWKVVDGVKMFYCPNDNTERDKQ